MTFLDRLQHYIDSKEDGGHDLVKKNFFKSVKKSFNDKKLTASTLTDLLAKATSDDTQRKNLFFLRRENLLSFDGQKKASVNSKAAQWIKTLYHKLNVPLDDISLAEIVAVRITEENKTILKNKPILRWQENPLSIKHINGIERELKGRLLLDGNDLPLAQAIAKNNEIDVDGLLPLLKSVATDAPFYLSALISQLCHYYHQGHPLYTNFIDKIIELGDDLPQLRHTIISSHVNLAGRVVKKDPRSFFILSASMQQMLLNLWQQDNHKNQMILASLEKLKTDDALLTTNNYPVLMKLLSDYSYRKAALNNEHKAHLVWKAYQQKITEKLPSKGLPLIANDYQLTAIKMLDKYLHLHPNVYKSQFFITLKDRIKTEGLTPGLLQDHLEHANKELLFAKWSGQHHSRASKLLACLYRQATYGRPFTPSDMDAMLVGNLPKIAPDEYQTQQQSAFDEQLQSVLLNQMPAKPSCLTKAIAQEVHHYQSWQRLSQQRQAQKQSVSEVVYQDLLIKKGLQQAVTNQALVADLQGNVLVEVTVTSDDINRVVQNNKNLECIDTLKQSVGQTTLCQLDVRGSPGLLEKFKRHLSTQYLISPSTIDALLDSPNCASVISITKEMILHVFLSLRVFEQLGIPQLTANERHALMVEIEQTVLKTSSKLLEKAYQNNHVNIALLNKTLDKSRKDLSNVCHGILVDRLCETMGRDKLATFVDTTLPKLKKELFKATTASNFDYLRTDTYNQLVFRISGTNHTSHNKMLGDDKQGLRFVARNHYNYDKITNVQTVRPFAMPTVEARVPSIALINCSSTDVIPDIAAKFIYSSTKLWLKNPTYQGPIIYNLLTSLHSSLWDCSFFEQKNKQRKSAGQILLGAIDFNIQQVQKGHADKLIYVANIGVNQHGHRLSYQAIDPVKAEATLMADMAFLSLFNHFSSLLSPALADDVISTYKQIHLDYVTFLARPTTNKQQCYFMQTSHGEMVADFLARKKASWAKCMTKQPASTNFHTLVVQALFHMIVNNVHHQLQFGMLVQTLAIFIEPLSLVGCKSANERTECVMGRNELLKSMNDTINPHPAKPKIMAALTMLINANSDYKTLSNVQKVVDEAYNDYNLQGSATIFSLQDQGAASKIIHTTNQDNKGVIKTTEPNTNCAETAYLTYLYQKNTSQMQSHHAPLAQDYSERFRTKLTETSCHTKGMS